MKERALCPTLIGREDQLSTLEDALLEAARGEGRVVILAGAEGVGKTRLASQLRLQAAKLGCAAIWGSCSEADLSLPYLPFLEAIGNHLANADLGAVRRRLGTSAARDLGPLFPQLGTQSRSAWSGDPQQAKLRLYEAVLSLLGIFARQQPLLVVIEDLHWADASTRELLDYAARRVRSFPILILGTCRPEEMDRSHPLQSTLHGWRRASIAETVELSSLSPDEVALMIRAIFDEPDVSPDFRDYLFQRSEGNPFVLEELLKEGLDRGDIFRSERGWWRKSIAELRIPASVRAAVLLRLERLETMQALALGNASVIGSSFDFATLVELCDIEADQLDEILRACIRQQFLEEDERQPGRFRFRHALTREVIYSDMTSPQRARIHGRVADILVRRGASKEECARHLIGANRAVDALPLLLGAAEEAVRRHGYRDAASLFQRALPQITDPPSRARTLGALGDALWRAGDPRAAAGFLNEGVAGLEAAGATRDAARHRLVLGRCHLENGDLSSARVQYSAARDGLEAGGPDEALALAYLRLSQVHTVDGDWEAAVQLARHAIATATAAGADGARIWAYVALGCAIGEVGDLEEAVTLIDRGYDEAMDLDLDIVAGNALNSRIIVRLDLARGRECEPLLEQMRSLPAGYYRALVPFAEGFMRLYLGHLERALESLREHAQSAVVVNNQHYGGMLMAWMLGEMGRRAEARERLLPPNPGVAQQEAVFSTIAWVRTHLALGTAAEALPAVDEFLARFGGVPPGRLHGYAELADSLVAILIAVSDWERASRIAATVETHGLMWSPWGKRASARVMLGENRAAAARALLVEAADEFAVAAFPLAEAETRLLLSNAEDRLGDPAAAVREARRASATALMCGAARVADEAGEALRALGVVGGVDPTQQVDGAEERRSSLNWPAFSAPHDSPGEPIVAVVVAGVRGNTQMTPNMSREERAIRVATLHRWARRAVERHHGVIAGFAGDAVMATFNGGDAGADHCLRAVQAALALRDKAVLLDLPVGVGVAVGGVVPGDDLDNASTPAIDMTIRMATRLEAAAGTGEVVVSTDAFRPVKDWVEQRGIVSAPTLLSRRGGRHGLTAQLLRRGPGRATTGAVEAQLGLSDVAWREGAVVAGAGVSRGRGPVLSSRELEVAALVADGLTNAEIAQRLHISDRTAATHVGNILSKLDLRGRAQIARWAAEQQLVVASSGTTTTDLS